MKTITYYRTSSFGGQDGREMVTKDFETEELAREDALKDTWNDGFRLYKVTLTFNGTVTETEEFIEKIPCLRGILYEKHQKTLKK